MIYNLHSTRISISYYVQITWAFLDFFYERNTFFLIKFYFFNSMNEITMNEKHMNEITCDRKNIFFFMNEITMNEIT